MYIKQNQSTREVSELYFLLNFWELYHLRDGHLNNYFNILVNMLSW